MSDLKTITLKGVELRWACLAEPSTRGEFASNKYQVDVVMNKDDAKLVKELKNSRQVIKDLGDGLFSITLKSTRKPKVVDAKKIVMSDEAVKGIGNGRVAAFCSAPGSAGTLAAGDQIKVAFPECKIVALEPHECSTLTNGGRGQHRIEGIGDKMCTLIHNVLTTDFITQIVDLH